MSTNFLNSDYFTSKSLNTMKQNSLSNVLTLSELWLYSGDRSIEFFSSNGHKSATPHTLKPICLPSWTKVDWEWAYEKCFWRNAEAKHTIRHNPKVSSGQFRRERASWLWATNVRQIEWISRTSTINGSSAPDSQNSCGSETFGIGNWLLPFLSFFLLRKCCRLRR